MAKKKALTKKNKTALIKAKHEKNHKRQARTITYIIILAICFCALIAVLLIQTKTINNPFTSKGELRTFSITDECSLIVGQLIHTISSDNSCELRCKTNCQIRDLTYENHEFEQKQNDCNQCACYCR